VRREPRIDQGVCGPDPIPSRSPIVISSDMYGWLADAETVRVTRGVSVANRSRVLLLEDQRLPGFVGIETRHLSGLHGRSGS
jgi:hypothetical protein